MLDARTKDRLIAAVDTGEASEYLVRLIRYNSVVGQPTDCWKFVSRCMTELGMHVDTYEFEDWKAAPMVVGRLGGVTAGPALMLEGHFDTDPVEAAGWSKDPFGGEVVDDKVYGRGAVDSKGSLAAMLAAISALRRSGATLRGTLLLASPSDSESRFRGADLLVDCGVAERCDWVISGEATNLESIDIAHSGLTIFRLIVHGRAAHPGQPHKGVNAVHETAGVISALADHPVSFRHEPSTHLPDVPRVFIMRVRNRPRGFEVPDECEVIFAVLSVPGQTPETIQADLERYLAEHSSMRTEVKYDLNILPRGWYYWRPPTEARDDDPGIRALRDATGAVTGKTPRLGGFPGVYTTGAAIASRINRGRRFGKPAAITFGPGDFAIAHAADEHVTIRQVTDAARIYALAAAELLGT